VSDKRTVYDWYRNLADAKRRGRWRYPLAACVAVFILLIPLILGMVAFSTLAVLFVVELVFDSPSLQLVAMSAMALVTSVVVADVIYFALRKSAPEDHECQQCGYDLTGNVSGVCPECGNDVGGIGPSV